MDISTQHQNAPGKSARLFKNDSSRAHTRPHDRYFLCEEPSFYEVLNIILFRCKFNSICTMRQAKIHQVSMVALGWDGNGADFGFTGEYPLSIMTMYKDL